jgi:hypothetical protein
MQQRQLLVTVTSIYGLFKVLMKLTSGKIWKDVLHHRVPFLGIDVTSKHLINLPLNVLNGTSFQSLWSVCGNVSVKRVPTEGIIYLEMTILAEAKVMRCHRHRLGAVNVIVRMVQIIIWCHHVGWIYITDLAGVTVRTQLPMHHSSWPEIR